MTAGKTTTATRTIRKDVVRMPPAEEAKIIAFGEILRKIDAANQISIIPILKKIEANTSFLKKLEPRKSQKPATTAEGAFPKATALPRVRPQKQTPGTMTATVEKATPPARSRLSIQPPTTAQPVVDAQVAKPQAPVEAVAILPEEKPTERKAAEVKQVKEKSARARTAKTKTEQVPKPTGQEAGIRQAKATPPRSTERPTEEKPKKRDRKGRFVAKRREEPRPVPENNTPEKKSLWQIMTRTLKAIDNMSQSRHGYMMREAAGRAVGGPFFDAALEIKDMIDMARDENTLPGKAVKKIGQKITERREVKKAEKAEKDKEAPVTVIQDAILTGFDDETDKVIDQLMRSEMDDQKRHEELIKVILQSGKKGEQPKETTRFPEPRQTGPGSRTREKIRKVLRKEQGASTLPKTPRMPGMPGGARGGILEKISQFPGMPRVPTLPQTPPTAPGGGAGGGILSRIGGGIGKLVTGAAGLLTGSAAVPVALGTVAAGSLGAAGYSAVTGKENPISAGVNKIGEKITGKKGWTVGDAIYDTFNPREIIGKVESGGKGYSAYQNKDSGIVSAGKYQFTAHGGKQSSLAQVLDNYSSAGGARAEEATKYSEIIKGGKAESLRNDKGFKSFLEQTGNETAMQQAQEKTFDERYYNTALSYAEKQGIDPSKMPKLAAMMTDTNIQGGMAEVTQTTKKRLADQGKSIDTASEDEVMAEFTKARKERLDRVAASKEAKGDTKTASMLRASKKRVDTVQTALDKAATAEPSTDKTGVAVAVDARKEETPPVTAERVEKREALPSTQYAKLEVGQATAMTVKPQPEQPTGTDAARPLVVQDVSKGVAGPSRRNKGEGFEIDEPAIPTVDVSGRQQAPDARDRSGSIEAMPIATATGFPRKAGIDLTSILNGALGDGGEQFRFQEKQTLNSANKRPPVEGKMGGPAIQTATLPEKKQAFRNKGLSFGQELANPLSETALTTTAYPADIGPGFKPQKGVNLTSLAKGFGKGDFTAAKQLMPTMPTATALAKGALANPADIPERMTTTMADIGGQVQQKGQDIMQGGMDMGSSFMSAIDKLTSNIGKMTGGDETEKSGAPVIRTEFDDTMLTLMAYDRI